MTTLRLHLTVSDKQTPLCAGDFAEPIELGRRGATTAELADAHAVAGRTCGLGYAAVVAVEARPRRQRGGDLHSLAAHRPRRAAERGDLVGLLCESRPRRGGACRSRFEPRADL